MDTISRWLGKTIGRFHIVDCLAVGGMSVVYRAYDPQRLQEVALKMLPDSYLDNALIASRFAQEVELVRTLQHDHLVDLYETGTVDGRQYIVLQLIDGGSLANLLQSSPRIPLGRTARIMRQIAAVLDYIHARGVVHRDVKLGNILLDRSGRAYLIDFGIAQWMSSAQVRSTDLIPGTARYMPPEQILPGRRVDHRADVYALGVVSYVLSVGTFPFTGEDERALYNQHLTTVAAQPSAVNPTLPAALDSVLAAALAKNPEGRFGSAGAFAAAFSAAVSGSEDLIIDVRPSIEHSGKPMPEDDRRASQPQCEAAGMSHQPAQEWMLQDLSEAQTRLLRVRLNPEE